MLATKQGFALDKQGEGDAQPAPAAGLCRDTGLYPGLQDNVMAQDESVTGQQAIPTLFLCRLGGLDSKIIHR